MADRLDGRIAVITGAGSGLGRRSALLFAEEGGRVVVADINAERAHRVAAEITDAGGSATARTCDVADPTQVRELVGLAVDTYGTLDVMFNNAGIPMVGVLEDPSPDELRRLFAVNVLGVVYGCQFAAPVMKAKGRGSIVNTSSASGLQAIPRNSIYGASKGAVNALTRNLAVELGPHNIRVNALCSMGGMSANMARAPDAPLVDEDAEDASWDPSRSLYVLAGPRPPKLIDHAHVALFFASDEAAWCSGVCMPVDGATSAKMSIDVGKKLASYDRADGA
ncbi:MAG: SDR family NAD(P)-dependent oxidoreductase [Sciscionella sp.]